MCNFRRQVGQFEGLVFRLGAKSLIEPRRRNLAGLAVCLTLFLSAVNGPANAGPLLDYIRDYDLNDYSLGVAFSTSQRPYAGAENSTIAYPYLTSFRHSAFTDDWLLIRGENLGFRYVSKSDWEIGIIGRIQTLGLGDADNDELSGLDPKRWAIEAGPIIGWRRWPVHVQFRSYWEMPDRHGGTTSELEFSLPREFERGGYFVPALKFTYMSEDYSDYYFGVSQVEMTPSRPEYHPGSIVNAWAGFTVGYRLSRQWLLTSTVGLEFLDSAVTASPIVEHDRLWSASIGFAYNADLFEPRDYDDANQQQAFEIRFAAFSSTIDTKVIREASNGQPGEEVDLEDFLGVPDNETIFQLDAIFRVAHYHRFEFGTFELRRNSTMTLPQDIDFGDQTFVAGTNIDTSVESEVIRAAYGYSFMRDGQKELGVSAGVSFLQFDTELRASATQQLERVKVSAPLPTLGVFGSLALGRKWRLSADIDVFALDFDLYDGYLAYASLDLDRKFGDFVGVGIGYNFYGTRLKSKDDRLRGTLRSRHHGPKLYLSFSF